MSEKHVEKIDTGQGVSLTMKALAIPVSSFNEQGRPVKYGDEPAWLEKLIDAWYEEHGPHRYSPQDLWNLVAQGDDRRLELIEGELIEMSPVGRAHTLVAGALYQKLSAHVFDAGLGEVTFEAGYVLRADTVCAPDVAYISAERLPPPDELGFYPVAPDLAVEVVSPSETSAMVQRKVTLYLNAGCIVWVIYPKKREVHVSFPGESEVILDEGQTLTGGDALPSFEMAVSDLFKYL